MGERRDLRDLLRDNDIEQKRIIDDLSSYREGQYEKDIAGDIKRGGFSDFIKNLFVGLFLIGIVIGSFWVSFLVGKRVLVPPIKNIPTIEFPKPKLITSVQISRAKVVETVREVTKHKEVQPVVQKPVETKPVASQTTTVVSTAPKFFKVVAGTFSSSGPAQSIAAKLAAKGFPYYVKKVSGMWRVQVGAFKTKSQAQTLVSRLKSKGFSPKIIYE